MAADNGKVVYEKAICVKDLVVSLSGKEILKKLSFSVPKDSITGFLGPNGAGKTTAMRAILGLLPFCSGSIDLLGCKIPKEGTKARERIGAMIERPTLVDSLTAGDNLKYIGSIYKPVKESRIDHVLNLVDLSKEKNKKFSAFSTGMKQRLAIALCMLHEPEMMLLDEPTSGMDPAGRVHVREILTNIHKSEGTGIFLSSHLLDEIQKLCDYVVIIDEGKTVTETSISNLLLDNSEIYELRFSDGFSEKGLEAMRNMRDMISEIKERPTGFEIKIEKGTAAKVNMELNKASLPVEALIPLQSSLEDKFIKLTERKES
ncbi:MAG: ABC transporter ATP-binding protein [Candidatus Riflebacteria bacterium]|nr:ABC transporter ATP-binding protein [Candidatus Riflebacteria bacterium]